MTHLYVVYYSINISIARDAKKSSVFVIGFLTHQQLAYQESLVYFSRWESGVYEYPRYFEDIVALDRSRLAR